MSVTKYLFTLPKRPHSGTTGGNRTDLGIIALLSLFIILNTLKISLFNYNILNPHTAGMFLYKFAVTFIWLVVIYSFIFKMKTPIVFILFYIVQLVYTYANFTYFSFFHTYLHLLQSIVLLPESINTASHFSVPKSTFALVLLIDLPILVLIAFRYFKIAALNLRLGLYRKLVVSSLLLIFLILECFNYFNGYSLVQFIKNYTSRNEVHVVERYGTFVNGIIDTLLNNSEKSLIKQFTYGKKISGRETANSSRPNFIAIQVESMDAGIVNTRYKGSFVTPFLNSLTTSSVYYPYVFSYHKAGGTSDAEFSIINSVEPLNTFPAIKLSKYDYPNSVARKLFESSYDTAAFHGNTGDYYNRDAAFRKMGFREFFDIGKMGLNEIGWGAPDNDVLEYVSQKVKNQKEPFFYYVITMSSHVPFENVKRFYNNDSYSDIKDELVRNYFNSMSYVDRSIGNFVSRIMAENKNTYILIWGDHTPGIKSKMYKQASFISDNKYFEFVPLFIITPDGRTYMEKEKAATFLDIAPTILNSAGVPFSIETYGENLLEPSAPEKDIPFRGDSYERKQLFKEISKQFLP